MELKQVKNSLKSRSDEDLRAAAREALKLAREDRAVRERLRGLHRYPDEG